MPTTLYERRRHDDRARRRRRALNHLIDTANTLDDAIGFVRRAVPHSRAWTCSHQPPTKFATAFAP